MLGRTLALLVFLSFAACTPQEPAFTPPVQPPDTNLCDAMCQHLAQLSCPEAQAVYDSDKPGPPDVPNVTCTAFCEETQKNGVMVNPRCVMEVSACDQIEAYRQKDPASCTAPSGNRSATP